MATSYWKVVKNAWEPKLRTGVRGVDALNRGKCQVVDRITRGSLAQAAGVNAETLRFYERRGLLPAPARTPAGYRLYEREAAAKVRFIQRAQELGFSLGEVEALLRIGTGPETDRGAEVKQLAEIGEQIEGKIRDLERIKAALRQLSCAGGTPGEPPSTPLWSALDR